MQETSTSRRRSRVKMGLVIFTACSLCLSTVALEASDSNDALSSPVSDDDENDEHSEYGDSLLELVHEAIKDASRPLHPGRQRNTQSRWGPRLKRWKKSLTKALTSSSAVSHAVTTTFTQPAQQDDTTIQQRRPKRILSDTGDMFDHEMHEGARLISASFGLISNTAGLLADGVRISGDTAAGFVGSSVRLMGIATKSVSSSFESAGRALEPKQDGAGRKVLTSERLRERQLGKGDGDHDFGHGRLISNTRNVASQSIRLVGNLVGGVGDVMLLAGEATETIASSTTGVAEDLVRIVEDFAGSVSSSLSPDEQKKRRIKAKVKIDSIWRDMNSDGADASYVTFGSHAEPAPSAEKEEEPPTTARDGFHNLNIDEESLVGMAELGMQELWKLVDFTVADTQGIPSFAGELLGVLLLCFLASLWVVSSSPPTVPKRREDPARATEITHVVLPTSEDEVSELSDLHDSTVPDIRSPLSRGLLHGKNDGQRCCSWFVCALLFPFRAFIFLLSMTHRALYNKMTIVLFLYSFAWLYLSRASQLRSAAIQRNAEAAGYRAAFDSLGSTSRSVAESVAWLNGLLTQIWRVPYDRNEQDNQWPNLKRIYPKFVRRSIRSNTYGRLECRSCDLDGISPDLFSTSACLPYGGLEPYISGRIGTLILDALGRSRSIRKDVAYASLYSFTLGRTPPLLKSIEFLGMSSHDRNKLHFNVEVDAILEDLSLVLEVKLSSLEYALLPSTKVSVHALDVTLPLKVAVSVKPNYPYISTVQLSLSEAPESSIRITPLSGESGLRGVDVGSLPLIREWIRDAMKETLSEYVTPKFVSLDVAAWLSSTPSCQRPGIPTRSLADITKLRQKTREMLNPDPRIASPSGVAITSVADSLPSHRSSSGTAFVQDNRRASFDSDVAMRKSALLIKPTSELSRLGMDRFMEKLSEVEEKERSEEEGVVGFLSKPLAIVTPFVVAIAANLFTQQLTKDNKK